MQSVKLLRREQYNLAGGTMVAPFDNLPKDFIIRQIMISLHLVGTKNAATTVFGNALAGRWDIAAGSTLLNIAQLGDLVPSVRLDSPQCDVDLNGAELLALYAQHNGREIAEMNAVTLAGAADWTLDLTIPVMLWDPASVSPDDSAVPARLLQGKSIMVNEIGLLPPAWYAVNVMAITAGVVSVYAIGYQDTGDNPSIRVPQRRVQRHLNPGGQTINIPPGTCLDAFLIQPAYAAFTAAQVTGASVNFDGNEVIPLLPQEDLCAIHNTLTVGDIFNCSLIAPDSIVPFISPPRANSKITKMPRSSGQGSTIQLYGTLVAPNLVYWTALDTAENEIREAARAYGVPEQTAVDNAVVKTTSGSPLSSAPGSKEGASKARILPKKIAPPMQSERRAIGLGPMGAKGPAAFKK